MIYGFQTDRHLGGCDCGGDCACDPGLGFFGVTAGAQAAISSSGAAGRIVNQGGAPIYVPGTADCAASGVSGGSQKLALVGGIGSMGLQVAGKIGLVAAGPVGWAAIGISTIIGIFSTIFSHHAQAVKKEQNVLCTAVPAANNYLDIIDQAVNEGKATPDHAIAALDSLSSDFHSAVSGIFKQCNAACVMQMCLDAALATQKQRYSALAGLPSSPNGAFPAPNTPITPARPNTVTATTPGSAGVTPSTYASFYSGAAPAAAPAADAMPSWLPIAAIALGAVLLMRR